MGRPPCCDKVGIKKGPWTPEEDIILVSYIQQHGPGNWRSVPSNTGLLRCSKSCRLRWTNYLRPGIKRGNFTPHEEGMIIHLQALLGNKWAAIATYLPQRTDNDIKNYWNTHLKKKLNKLHSALDPMAATQTTSERSSRSLDLSSPSSSTLCGLNHQTIATSTSAPVPAATSYVSSAENISRLLESWMRPSPKPNYNNHNHHHIIIEEKLNQNINGGSSVCNDSSPAATSLQYHRPKGVDQKDNGGSSNDGNQLISNEDYESILSYENTSNVAWNHRQDSCACDHQEKENIIALLGENKKPKSDENSNPPLSFLENWFLDESGAIDDDQVEDECMDLSPIF